MTSVLLSLFFGAVLAAAPQFSNAVPEYRLNVIAVRPTADGVTLSLFSPGGTAGELECGGRRVPFDLKAGESRSIRLDGLAPGLHQWRSGELAGSFRTARRPGEDFEFVIQADSHLDEATSPDIYVASLLRMAADRPDFVIDLGDTFMTGKHPSRESAARQYLAQRYYLGLVGRVAPLFLVLGNHDGEEIRRKGETGLAEWALEQRRAIFPNPLPDGFYRGNPDGKEDYYAWEWGDALFVVLDPYWYSTGNKGGREMDNMKLGDRQTQWLERTLRESGSKYKFIFIHQLTGGLDSAGRGGVEAAKLHQWAEIHQLLKQFAVTAVFHGHDHFFARQELDGIVYQLTPQPACRNGRVFAAEYGYRQGDFLPGPGYLRVKAGPAGVDVECIDPVTGSVKASYRLQ